MAPLTALLCATCKTDKALAEFSKRQLKKQAERSCKACIDNKEQAEQLAAHKRRARSGSDGSSEEGQALADRQAAAKEAPPVPKRQVCAKGADSAANEPFPCSGAQATGAEKQNPYDAALLTAARARVSESEESETCSTDGTDAASSVPGTIKPPNKLAGGATKSAGAGSKPALSKSAGIASKLEPALAPATAKPATKPVAGSDDAQTRLLHKCLARLSEAYSREQVSELRDTFGEDVDGLAALVKRRLGWSGDAAERARIRDVVESHLLESGFEQAEVTRSLSTTTYVKLAEVARKYKLDVEAPAKQTASSAKAPGAEALAQSSTTDAKGRAPNEGGAPNVGGADAARTALARRCKLRLAEVYNDAAVSGVLAEFKGDLEGLEQMITLKLGWKGDAAKRHRQRALLERGLIKQGHSADLVRKTLTGWSYKMVAKEVKRLRSSSIDRQSHSEPEADAPSGAALAAQQTAEPKSKKRAREATAAATCDKCDGQHPTERCPHYKKSRENHPDAQKRQGIVDLGGDGGNVFIRPSQARVHRQPGDGSCLFHSLRTGLGGSREGIPSTHALRCTLADWVRKNAHAKIADTPVKEWVRWDAGCSVDSYANRMRHAAWGGGIEMAACSRQFDVRIHVWERVSAGYKRISCFETKSARKTVNVLYCGGIHYDYLEVTGTPVRASQVASRKPVAGAGRQSRGGGRGNSFSSPAARFSHQKQRNKAAPRGRHRRRY